MSGCVHEDCGRTATHYPCLIVPAKGFPATKANSLEMVIGLAACLEHPGDRGLADLPDESRKWINAVLLLQGKVAADFDRARVEARRLGDKAWQTFQSMRAESEGGGRA